MAKRKRLNPTVNPAPGAPARLSGAEHASLGPSLSEPRISPLSPSGRAPIAQVAGAAAMQSALEDVTEEMRQARASGRLVQALPLDQVVEDHMVRDRLVQDPEDMASLIDSLRARGQQTPIEVVDLGADRFGLISGWRRLQALRALWEETQDAQFSTVQALIKPIVSASDSYVAMVEENEIRSDLSFYERARLAAEAVQIGIYGDAKTAIQTLFANATPAKRSKISAFVRLHEALGSDLRFPAAIPEKVGLALVGALEKDLGKAGAIRKALRRANPETQQGERAVLDRALKPAPKAQPPVGDGVDISFAKGRLTLTGAGVTPALAEDLRAWLKARLST